MKDLKLVRLNPRPMAKKGQAIMGTLVAVIAGGALLVLGVFLFAKLGGAIDTTGFTTTENTTYQAVRGNVLDAFEIGAIVLMVIVIVGVIALLSRLA